MRSFTLVLTALLIAVNPFSPTPSFGGGPRSDSPREPGLAVRVSLGGFIWVGAQVDAPLTRRLSFLGAVDVNVTSQPACDQLVQGSLAFAFVDRSDLSAFLSAGYGIHHCGEAKAATGMLNLGIGVQLRGRLPLGIEYRTHIPLGSGGEGWDVTRGRHHILAVSVPVL